MKQFLTLFFALTFVLGVLFYLSYEQIIGVSENVILIIWMWLSIAVLVYFVYQQRKNRK